MENRTVKETSDGHFGVSDVYVSASQDESILEQAYIESQNMSAQDTRSHTILLVQPTGKPDSRTYSDYEALQECLEGICKIYEEHLKRSNPMSASITYDISQLFDFIDQLTDLCCLVYQKNSGTYVPHNKEWLKEKIYVMLRKQAGK